MGKAEVLITNYNNTCMNRLCVISYGMNPHFSCTLSTIPTHTLLYFPLVSLTLSHAHTLTSIEHSIYLGSTDSGIVYTVIKSPTGVTTSSFGRCPFWSGPEKSCFPFYVFCAGTGPCYVISCSSSSCSSTGCIWCCPSLQVLCGPQEHTQHGTG